MTKQHEEDYEPRKAYLWEALLVFGLIIAIMFVAIIKYEVDPHIPMFVGVIIAALMALKIGYTWEDIESSMIKGISQALQSVMILAIIGILVGVWIASGVVPSMIYYGLMILRPSIFLVATVLVSSVTSLATGTSWGTAGTMGIALMGIAQGMGIPAPITAGAIISGAYFGDKMSPLSDTTNLAPAMSGTDVFTHIKTMAKPTITVYIITLIIFAFITTRYSGGQADSSEIDLLKAGLEANFKISPILLLPPVVVIVSIAFKMPAIPGITLGILVAAVMGPIFQAESLDLGGIFVAAMDGFVAETGNEALDSLLTSGGLMSMMFSISLTIIAMMFGGIAEMAGILEAIVETILKRVSSLTGLVTSTILTAILSNVTMPEQYISVVVPGRMYAPAYRERGYHPKLLSSTLEAGGTISAPLIPWNTCGVYMASVLGVSTMQYLPFSFFNILMPIFTIALTAIGQNTHYIEDDPETVIDPEEV